MTDFIGCVLLSMTVQRWQQPAYPFKAPERMTCHYIGARGDRDTFFCLNYTSGDYELRTFRPFETHEHAWVSCPGLPGILGGAGEP